MTIKHNDMKRQLSLLAALFLAFTAPIAMAQNADNQVKKIVKSFRDHKNVVIDFTYEYVADDDKHSDLQEGKAYLQGEAYKVIMKEQHNISDGTTIWCYLVDDEEVMVSDATEGTDNTPLKLLTTLDKDYKASFAGNEEIELSNPKGDFKKVTLKIDSKKNTLKSIDVYADDGSKLILNILETKFDQELKDGFFTFDEKAYPNVDIIDMR